MSICPCQCEAKFLWPRVPSVPCFTQNMTWLHMYSSMHFIWHRKLLGGKCRPWVCICAVVMTGLWKDCRQSVPGPSAQCMRPVLLLCAYVSELLTFTLTKVTFENVPIGMLVGWSGSWWGWGERQVFLNVCSAITSPSPVFMKTKTSYVSTLCCYVSLCIFKWVYGNLGAFLVGIQCSTAYHIQYTTGYYSPVVPLSIQCWVSPQLTESHPWFSFRMMKACLHHWSPLHGWEAWPGGFEVNRLLSIFL